MPDLPPAIAAYFRSAHDADAAVLGSFFTTNAHIHDEGRDYVGLDAIRGWRVDTHASTPSVARPLEARETGSGCVVTAEVSGAFPNSPVILEHRFDLIDGSIASLEIG